MWVLAGERAVREENVEAACREVVVLSDFFGIKERGGEI
jgi:hypothetical protein